MSGRQNWPELPMAELRPTLETLQLMTQVVGKARLAQTPWVNHSWHVPLYVSARGLTTSLVPAGGRGFDIELDFVASRLAVRVTDGEEAVVDLAPGCMASFYRAVVDALSSLGLDVRIDQIPSELPDPTPFPDDHAARPYDPQAARTFWLALVQAERVLQHFRTAFLGKCSPVHFFWGSFDLAVTRFSGRQAPLHPGGVPHLPDAVAQEAYSHEVSSAGFWPGSEEIGDAAFYSYAYPAPPGFAAAQVSPAAARHDPALGEFILPYEAVRGAADPDAALVSFLQSTYEAAAILAHWNRDALECGLGTPRRPRPLG
jgi:hypothetical protein